jgi:hypothetical protein
MLNFVLDLTKPKSISKVCSKPMLSVLLKLVVSEWFTELLTVLLTLLVRFCDAVTGMRELLMISAVYFLSVFDSAGLMTSVTKFPSLSLAQMEP